MLWLVKLGLELLLSPLGSFMLSRVVVSTRLGVGVGNRRVGVGVGRVGVGNRRNAHEDVVLDKVGGCALFGFSGRRWSWGVEGVLITVVVVADGAGAGASIGAVVVVGVRVGVGVMAAAVAVIADGEVDSGRRGRTATGTTTTVSVGRGNVGVVIMTPIVERKSHANIIITTTSIPSTNAGS